MNRADAEQEILTHIQVINDKEKYIQENASFFEVAQEKLRAFLNTSGKVQEQAGSTVRQTTGEIPIKGRKY